MSPRLTRARSGRLAVSLVGFATAISSGTAGASSTEYLHGQVSFRGADLEIRLALGPETSLQARLDVPSLLYVGEPAPIERRGDDLLLELPFGLGEVELEPAKTGWSGSGALRGEPLRVSLVPGSPPPYASEEVRFPSSGAELAATLLTPRTPGQHPAVVIVHASGDQSRATWEYRGYADFFARRGFTVLFYDKRGCGDSTGSHWGDDAAFEGLTADVLAAVDLLRGRGEVLRDRIGLVGGSQAGWIMLLAASRSPTVAFLVATSTAAVSPMEQMMQFGEHRMRADGLAPESIGAALAHLRLFAYVAATGRGWELLQESTALARASPFAEYVFLPSSNPRDGWMGRHVGFDPVPLLAHLSIPVLALWGERDLLVPPAENAGRYRAWFGGGDPSKLTVRVFPEADHRLEVPSGRDASGRWHWFGMAPGLFETIDGWLRAQGIVSSAP